LIYTKCQHFNVNFTRTNNEENIVIYVQNDQRNAKQYYTLYIQLGSIVLGILTIVIMKNRATSSD